MSPERTELIEALTELSRQYPHWRFGQHLANVAAWADADIWDAEDTQMLSAARAHLDAIAQRDGEPQRARAPKQSAISHEPSAGTR